MSINSVVLVGRLTQDPRLTFTTTGKAVTNFGLAVDKPGKDRGVNFFDIVCWEKEAENAAQYLKKGRQVAVQGSLDTREYEHNGQKRKVVEVVAFRIQYLGSPRDDG